MMLHGAELSLTVCIVHARVTPQVAYAPLRKIIRKFSRDGTAMLSITYNYGTTLTNTKAVPVLIVLEQAKPYIDQDQNDLKVCYVVCMRAVHISCLFQ
jgi:hypothetical protein